MTDILPTAENSKRPDLTGRVQISERLAAKLSSEADDYSKPRTLLGKGINNAWDFAYGEAKTNLDKANRAIKSDQIAEITADTVAAVPRLNFVSAGLARGVLLSDVSGNSSAFRQKFVLDTAQGVALHGIGRMGAGNLRAASSELSAGLRPTLGAELKGHMFAGAGFGAVKATFNEQTWKDKNGQFSVASGLENVTLSTALGGTVGMPSGLVGARFARASSVLIGTQAEQTVLGALAKNTITGASAGMTGGAVFGGVEASHRSFTPSSILGGVKDGAVIGLFTGGLLGASERVHVTPNPVPGAHSGEQLLGAAGAKAASAHSTGVNETRLKGAGESPASERPFKRAIEKSATEMPDISDKGGRSLTPQERHKYLWSDAGKREAYESFAFKPFDQTRVADYQARLGKPVSEEHSVFVASSKLPAEHIDVLKFLRAESGKVKPGFEDFVKHLDHVQEPVRVYEVQGHSTKIVVPEEYARQLDEVRQLRLRNEAPTVYDGLPMDVKVKLSDMARKGDARGFTKYMPASEVPKVIDVLDAGLKLAKHPLAMRALPEDLIPILDAVPVPGLIKEVRLNGGPNIFDRHSRIEYGAPKFASDASVTPDGKVDLYALDRNPRLTEVVLHEWTHLTKWTMREHSRLFDLATSVDKVDRNVDHRATRVAQAGGAQEDYRFSRDIYHSSEHASRNLDEGWAVGKAEELMKADPDTLFVYMEQAPVRAMVLSAALEHSVSDMRPGLLGSGGSLNETFMKRVRYIDDAVRPLAQKQLVETIKNGTDQQRANAAELLGLFGDKSHIDALRGMALNKRNDVLAQASSNPEQSQRTLQRIAFDSMVKLSGSSKSEQFEFAFEEGRRNPALRSMARDTILRMDDFRSSFYRNTLDYMGDRGALPDMLRMMRSPMGDQKGREVLYQEMMANLTGDSAQAVEWSLRVIENVPSMREHVMNQLSQNVEKGLPPRSLRDIETVVASRRGTFADGAQEAANNLLSKISNTRKVEEAQRLANGSESARLKLLEGLVAAKDQRAISPLLALSVSGNPQVEATAIQYLGNYSPALVKFYGRQLRAGMGADRQKVLKLERVLEGRGGPGSMASGS